MRIGKEFARKPNYGLGLRDDRGKEPDAEQLKAEVQKQFARRERLMREYTSERELTEQDVRCVTCGLPLPGLKASGQKEHDGCWELRTRIEAEPTLASRILARQQEPAVSSWICNRCEREVEADDPGAWICTACHERAVVSSEALRVVVEAARREARRLRQAGAVDAAVQMEAHIAALAAQQSPSAPSREPEGWPLRTEMRPHEPGIMGAPTRVVAAPEQPSDPETAVQKLQRMTHGEFPSPQLAAQHPELVQAYYEQPSESSPAGPAGETLGGQTQAARDLVATEQEEDNASHP